MSEINRENWDSFVLSQNGSFLQSFSWGQFQKATGKKILFLKEKDWQALVIVNPLHFGKTYLYVPHGPIWNKEKNNEQVILENFFNKLKSISKEHNAIFIKIEPKISDEKIAAILKNQGCKKMKKSIQPEDTLIINISRPEKEIFESFTKRCRNEIKLAEKKNVSLYSDNTDTSIKKFLELLEKTARRNSFRTHPFAYYETLIKTFKSACDGTKSATCNETKYPNQIDLFFAKIEENIISACIVVYFGDTASYIHAASAGQYRAANALVWTAMREAKKKQYAYFDLYGVSPLDAGENHPWRGLTKFKESFNGNRVRYIGAFDYPISNLWFNLYKLGKKFKN